MPEEKFITLDRLRTFKEQLDNSYSDKFITKEQVRAALNGNTSPVDEFATDEEVERLLNDIFGSNSAPSENSFDFATDEEVDNLLNNAFD